VTVEGIGRIDSPVPRTLWNTYSFFVTYANLDGWSPEAIGASDTPSTHVLDRWARSRLHRTVRTVTDALEAYDALTGSLALEQLVDDLSNWYVRRSRSRFWKSSDPAAHATLHECLTTLTMILAPYCPFLADEMHRNLGTSDVRFHLADWPTADESAIDDQLEAEMSAARILVSLGRKARNDAKIGVRQPLPRAIALLGRDVTLRDDVVQEIADELNVKRFEVVASLEGLLSYRVVPNFKALGPRVGKSLPRVKELLTKIDGAEVRHAFDERGSFDLDVDGEDGDARSGRRRDQSRAARGARARPGRPACGRARPHARRRSPRRGNRARVQPGAQRSAQGEGLRDQRPDRRRLRIGQRRSHGRDRPPPRLDRGRSARHDIGAVRGPPPADVTSATVGGEPIQVELSVA